jgi:hypothetical protein
MPEEPLSERLAAAEVQVAHLTTNEELRAQEGSWVRHTNLLTDAGRKQLVELLAEARAAVRRHA